MNRYMSSHHNNGIADEKARNNFSSMGGSNLLATLLGFILLVPQCPGKVAEWWNVCTITKRVPFLRSGVN